MSNVNQAKTPIEIVTSGIRTIERESQVKSSSKANVLPINVYAGSPKIGASQPSLSAISVSQNNELPIMTSY